MHRFLTCLLVVLLIAVADAEAGRYESHKAQFAKGPHMTAVGATFFGSEGIESFIAGGQVSSGDVVAIGNAWGPQFPDDVKPRVLGSGRHAGQEQVRKDRKGHVRIQQTGDMAGMIVCFDSELQKVKQVIRLDWGVGRFDDGAVTYDGKQIYVAGTAGRSFDTIKRSGVKVAGTVREGDGFFMKLDSNGKVLGVVMINAGDLNGTPRKLIVDRKDNAYIELVGEELLYMCQVEPGGRVTKLHEKKGDRKGFGRVGYRAVDPHDGGVLFGGDRNTNTGREPWRQPYLYKYDEKGEKVWSLWEWNSRLVGSDKYRLVSDSAARCASYAPNGDLLVGGWSDGGNSVFHRQPKDLDSATGKPATGMSTWGMKNANSIAWVMRIDNKTLKMKAWTYWVCYIPEGFAGGKGNWPNFASIEKISFLPGESITICGGAATGLVPTPNAFRHRPKGDPGKYGGKYVAVFRPDLSNVTFSSYLPGYVDVNIGPSRDGVVIVGQTEKDDGTAKPVSPPIHPRAAQKTFGGAYDAHIVLMKNPAMRFSSAD